MLEEEKKREEEAEEDSKGKTEFEEKMDRMRRRYERDIHSFRYEIEERDYRLKAYEDKFNKIKQPPLLYAYVTRMEGNDLGSDQVVVARANELLKVSTGLVEKKELGMGQYVWVHPQTYAIVEASQRRHDGILAKVLDVMDDRLVISAEGDFDKRIIKCGKEMAAKVKPGFQLSVLPPVMDIVEILPNIEVRTLLLGEKPNANYKMVGGLSEAIERIKDVVVLPFQERRLFDEIHLEEPRGILLYGPPGCGKTLLVRAIAAENEMTFFNISIADILSKWVGESERIIKEIFRQANERRPSIIFFDEIEALFTVRGMLDTSGVHKNIIAQILGEMDGLLELRDVFVIGATNRPDLMDPALLRPGRFDEIIEIPRPDRASVREILGIYLTDDLPVSEELLKQHPDKKAALEDLRTYMIEELFGENKWITVKIDADAKEPLKTVKRKDVVSGAIVAAIVKTAKKNFIKRILGLSKSDRKKEGLTREDLRAAIEEECKEHAITELYVWEKRQREALKQTGPDPMVG